MAIDTAHTSGLELACARDDLSQGLQLVTRAVSSRTTVQILSGVLLTARGDEVELAATDMEMSIRCSVPARVGGEGATVVPGRLLADIVRLLPSGEVAVELSPAENLLTVTAGNSSYRLNTYAVDDFPRLPSIALGDLTSLERDVFLQTVSRVARAASRDESRPVLTGILVRLAGEALVMAATDSYRLSVKETALGGDTGRELEAVVPARALNEVARIVQASTAGTVEVGLQENHVVFVVDGIWVTARRIDGQFPNYAQLKPEAFEVEVRLPREELLDAVRRVGLMAIRNAPLRLRFEEGQLVIQAQSQDVGEAREVLPVPYSGDVLEIGFNPEFLRDGLESVTDDEVRLRLISPLRPGLIAGERDDFWYLIMPIRLAG